MKALKYIGDCFLSLFKSIGNVLLYIAVIVVFILLTQIPVVSDFFSSVSNFLFATGEVLKWVLGLAIVVAFCSLPIRFILFVFRSICSFFRKK